MSQYDFHRGDNPRILVCLGIVLAATSVLIIGLGWRQLVASRKYEEIEKRQTERRILMPGPSGGYLRSEGESLVGNRAHYSAVVYLDDLRPEFRREFVLVRNAADEKLRNEWTMTLESQPSDTPPLANRLECAWTARQNVIQRYIDEINRITGRDDTLSRTKIIRHFNEQLLLPLPLVQDLDPDEYARLVEQVPGRFPDQDPYRHGAILSAWSRSGAHARLCAKCESRSRVSFRTTGSRPLPLRRRSVKPGSSVI